ncbi:hypothetical protein B0T10DRAFT_117674 [Thelonectria olida]|uniref:Uncharacterized protein n=1 Tax=Thelonectria olida TaxID=1576542 RepID=A0A9P8WGZ2_9HYPO|nr:hypothetical protein B0T10DRAFT_117674 [Thelonectria olida]
MSLPPYDCADCSREETADVVREHGAAFTTALFSLMSTLADRGTLTRSLTLELSVSSPSDTRHAFKDFLLGQRSHYQAGHA